MNFLVLNIIIILWQIEIVPAPTIVTFERVIWFVGILSLLITNLYQLKYNKHEMIHKTDTRTVESQSKLIKAQDTELEDLDKKYDELERKYNKSEEDREFIKSEYKSLAGIDIQELLNFNGMKMLQELQALQISVLTEELKKSRMEVVQLKHNGTQTS